MPPQRINRPTKIQQTPFPSIGGKTDKEKALEKMIQTVKEKAENLQIDNDLSLGAQLIFVPTVIFSKPGEKSGEVPRNGLLEEHFQRKLEIQRGWDKKERRLRTKDGYGENPHASVPYVNSEPVTHRKGYSE